MEKQPITLECEVSKPNKTATWLKEGKPIEASDRVEIGVDGTRHFLTIKSSTLDDEAKYTIKIDEKQSTGKLTVEGGFTLLIIRT